MPVELVRPLSVPYIVVHPGATATSRMYPPALVREVVDELVDDGWVVAVTGGREDVALARDVSGSLSDSRRVLNLAGRLSVPELAAVLQAAAAVVVGNTGPAHLAAAVGTPVVSLFSPVVPAIRWAPHTDRRVVLGDQAAGCRNTRATTCPVPGHPCLSSVTPKAVVGAVRQLTGSIRPIAALLSGAER
jgi:ADP-heptose:LPS heptosyltransferase